MGIARIGTWAVAVVIGIVYGVAGTIGQSATWAAIPVGLLVALVGTGALLVAVRVLTADRWAALATGVGALVATFLFSGTGPGGSVVVPAPADGELPTGAIWSIAVPLLVAVVVAWPARRPTPAATADAAEHELDLHA
ncbi:histidinol dehydrogenase [Microbacterium sp.]|uniref:histidinol dehydrogenase n=1 Tax=Microbacterium sp. TaxID=51671 RepID=UPI0039E30E5D